MKKFSKMMAAVLALVMCLSLLPMAAFAEDEPKDPAKAPFGEPYDKVIETAGEVKDKDVPNAVSDANTAIKGIDEETNGKIGDAQQAVKDNEAVVNAANDTVNEAVNTANSAKQAVEAAQQTVASAGTLAEREAALEIANAAVETAEKAVTDAQNALTTANEAYTKAEQAVAEAQKALDEITEAHNAAVGGAQGDLAEAKAAAKAKLDAAQAELDAAGTTRKGLETAVEEANGAFEAAKTAVTTAKDLLDEAKDNAAGLKVDEVLADKDKQEALTNQTQDVQTKKEALDALGTTDEAEQAVKDAEQVKKDAQTAFDSFDKTGLEGKDEEQSKQDYKDASDELDRLKRLTDDLDAKRAECWDAYTPVNSEWNELSGQITTWKGQDTPITGGNIEFTNSAFTSWNNETLREAVETWKTTGRLSGYAQYAFGQSNYSTRSPKEFMDVVSACLDGANMPDFARCDELKEQKDKLYRQWEDALNNLNNNKTAIDQKQTEVNDLDELLKKFEELNGLESALDEATRNAETAQKTLDGLKGQIEAAKDAYGQAVAELSKTLKGAGTAYDATKDYEKLMEDAAKLQNAIDKLNELNQAIADKELKDAAQKEAQYNYDHAMAGLEAAEAALKAAQEKVKSAAANTSQAELAKLTANLAKAQADFEAAKKAAEDAKTNKDKADQAKTDADRNAANAANRVQDAINDLNDIDIGGTTGGTTIDDVAVPLANGPVTCAQFVDYLWRHEGSPEAEGGLFADHEYAPAIAWALSAGLIDEAFQPDELVTVADVRDILGSFAQVFGTNAVAAADLATLAGDEDEAVLNCDEVLAEFFGEEYTPAEVEDDIAA